MRSCHQCCIAELPNIGETCRRCAEATARGSWLPTDRSGWRERIAKARDEAAPFRIRMFWPDRDSLRLRAHMKRLEQEIYKSMMIPAELLNPSGFGNRASVESGQRMFETALGYAPLYKK